MIKVQIKQEQIEYNVYFMTGRECPSISLITYLVQRVSAFAFSLNAILGGSIKRGGIAESDSTKYFVLLAHT